MAKGDLAGEGVVEKLILVEQMVCGLELVPGLGISRVSALVDTMTLLPTMEAESFFNTYAHSARASLERVVVSMSMALGSEWLEGSG